MVNIDNMNFIPRLMGFLYSRQISVMEAMDCVGSFTIISYGNIILTY